MSTQTAGAPANSRMTEGGSGLDMFIGIFALSSENIIRPPRLLRRLGGWAMLGRARWGEV